MILSIYAISVVFAFVVVLFVYSIAAAETDSRVVVVPFLVCAAVVWPWTILSAVMLLATSAAISRFADSIGWDGTEEGLFWIAEQYAEAVEAWK